MGRDMLSMKLTATLQQQIMWQSVPTPFSAAWRTWGCPHGVRETLARMPLGQFIMLHSVPEAKYFNSPSLHPYTFAILDTEALLHTVPACHPTGIRMA